MAVGPLGSQVVDERVREAAEFHQRIKLEDALGVAQVLSRKLDGHFPALEDGVIHHFHQLRAMLVAVAEELAHILQEAQHVDDLHRLHLYLADILKVQFDIGVVVGTLDHVQSNKDLALTDELVKVREVVVLPREIKGHDLVLVDKLKGLLETHLGRGEWRAVRILFRTNMSLEMTYYKEYTE